MLRWNFHEVTTGGLTGIILALWSNAGIHNFIDLIRFFGLLAYMIYLRWSFVASSSFDIFQPCYFIETSKVA